MATIDRVRELIDYDPLTGEFRSRKRRGWKSKCGSISRGYLRIKIDGRSYLAHVLAWAIMTGKWPDREIDHRNRVKLDNRWENYRLATRLQNCNNRSLSRNSPSGVNGVTQLRGKWRVRLRGQFLGYFPTKEEAIKVAKRAQVVW